MKVGFIGTGSMGRPMLRNLVVKGFGVVAYDVQPAALERAARRFPDNPAILYEGRRLGYRELGAPRAARRAAWRSGAWCPATAWPSSCPTFPRLRSPGQAVQKLGAIAVSANARSPDRVAR